MRSPLALVALALAAAPTAAQDGTLTLPSPDLSALGYASHHGLDVAALGDATDSGVADILVGQPLPHAVSAFLRDGRTGAVLHEFTSNHGGPSSSTNFGHAVAALPDVSGDGRDDILIAGWKEPVPGGGATGRVYVYERPAPGGTPVLLHELTPPGGSNLFDFGRDVAGIDDVDGDGWGDVLVGQPGPLNSGLLHPGNAFVYSGKTGALLHTLQHPDAAVLPTTYGFGQAVAPVPDVDGDGFDDVAVSGYGMQDAFGGTVNRGVCVFSGATGALIRKLDAPGFPDDVWGKSLAGLEDKNGDGRGELVIGDPYLVGRIEVWSVMDGTKLAVKHPPAPAPGMGFGSALDARGDADGDGLDDLLVGAPFEAYDGFLRGRAYVYRGSDFSLLSVLEVPQNDEPGVPPSYSYRFGHAVDLSADANGDGLADYLVGAPDLPIPGHLKGATLTFFCATEVTSTVTVDLGAPPNPDALTWTGYPALGDAVEVQVDHTTFAASAALDVFLIGLASTDLPLPGGTLLVDPGSLLDVRVAAPGVPVSLVVPPLCQLVGLSVVVQGASLQGPDTLATGALVLGIGTR